MQRDARVALLLLLVAPAPARECGQDELLARDITGCVSFAHIRYLNPGGAVWLGDALHNNSDLELLDLHHTHLGDEDALALAAGLKNNTVLRRLAMHNNHITCVGSAALGEALAENDALQELSLSSNSVGDKGMTAIAKSLHVNTALRRLDLYFNGVGDAGAIALAEALKVNRAIRMIHLDSNEIEEAGGLALAAAIAGGGGWRDKTPQATIGELGLMYNALTNKAVEALIAAAKLNPSLHSLGLGHNHRVHGAADEARKENAGEMAERKKVAAWLVDAGLVKGEWFSADGPVLSTPTARAVMDLKAHTMEGLLELRHETAASLGRHTALAPVDEEARAKLVALLLERVAAATAHDEL